MPRFGTAETHDCPSQLMSDQLDRTIKQLNAADDAGDKDKDQKLYRELQALEEAASWSRPTSAAGALMHLMLATGEVSTLPDSTSGEHERMHRLVERNLYAVRAYLLSLLAEEQRAGMATLSAFYMVDDVGDINPLLGNGFGASQALNPEFNSQTIHQV